MRILVTGANGYLGTGVVAQLLKDGANVVAADFFTEDIPEGAEKTACDLFSVDRPYEYFGEPDVLLHLAWRNGFLHYADSHINDLPKHYEFLKKMLEGGLKRVAVMGSMHEIGFFEGAIDENTPCRPLSMYGVAKDALRKTTEILADKHGAVFQWLRGYYIVGNTTRGCSVFSKIAQAAQEGKREFPFTTGQNQYDFLDYEEFCLQAAKTVEQEEVTGIVNICSGKPEKLADRAERFIRENGFDLQLQYGKFPDRPYDSKAVWGNDKKIRKIMDCEKNQ